MVVYVHSDPRVNKTQGLADARREAASIRADIKRGDDELSHKTAVDCYNTFENMKAAQAWNYKRHSLVSRLNLLEREIGWQSPDNSHKPHTGSYFVGSDT